MKLLCVFVLAVALASAQDAPAKDDTYEDEYASYYEYDNVKEVDKTNDKKVLEDIKKYLYDDDKLEFYDDTDFGDDYDSEDIKDYKDKKTMTDEERRQADKEDYALLWGDDSVAPLPVPDTADDNDDRPAADEVHEVGPILQPDEQIVEETLKILAETNDAFDEQKSEDDEKAKSDDEPADKGVPDEKIVEETKDILKSLDDAFDAKSDASKVEVDQKPEEFSDDDTVDNVEADLNADLDKLFETIDKLSVDEPAKEEEIVEKVDNELFKDGPEDSAENNDEYEEVDFDKILEDLNNELVEKTKQDDVKSEVKEIINDEINEPNPDDTFEKDAESLSKESELKSKPILFPDAFVDEPKNAESIENDGDDDTDASIETIDKESNLDNDIEDKNIDISTFNSEEINILAKQFSDTHSELLDVKDTFNDDTAEHIKLSVDEPTIVTSPNYPDPYLSNTVKDWVFDGEGTGIEINITDLFVNGAMGHYLLVKPGGADDSVHDGLLFTYRLDSERRFRFSDVDRLLLRFDSSQGGWGMRGFRLSARMIAPIPEEPAPLPTPSPVLQPPHSTHTLFLATAAAQFHQHRETFRLLLADMALRYIQDTGMDAGLNATSEVTQITAVSACPVSWPSHELCTAVTFGVPLVYEEAEEGAQLDAAALGEMWSVYSVRDPFALRLRQMGIAEFEPPRAILFAWLLLGSGVLLGAVLVVLLLYRFHCFQDYTRMKDFNDTDSLQNDKRGLDLYPTPHQPLPPLYSELDYKWTENDDTRVDMSGLSNRSYARDMYDFESDEEIPQRAGPVPRDSFAQPNSNA